MPYLTIGLNEIDSYNFLGVLFLKRVSRKCKNRNTKNDVYTKWSEFI